MWLPHRYAVERLRSVPSGPVLDTSCNLRNGAGVLDWLIVGGGIHGAFIARVLLEEARVPVDRLPSISEIGDAAAFLPDTAEVALTGRLLPLDEGRVALSIQEVKAARIPLPQRLVPRALQRLGRRDEPGLPRNALALPLPKGASSAYLDSDSLVLIGRSVQRSRN